MSGYEDWVRLGQWRPFLLILTFGPPPCVRSQDWSLRCRPQSPGFHILVSPPQNVKNAAYSSQLLHTFGFCPDNVLLFKVSDTNH